MRANRIIGLLVGVLLGELAAVVVFSGPIEHQMAAQATPVTTLASATLEQARQTRAGLDGAVERANARRDEALVVARCEFNPSPQCPQVRITGVPGAGPEARTANEFLADAQRELDTAIADRDARAADLDHEVAVREAVLEQAHDRAMAGGPAARWQAMNGYTLDHPGALVLRLLMIGLFVLLSLSPLWLRRWWATRRERAEADADTAIAVKQAEVRATVEQMWAEQQLTSTRLAVDAQNEIDAQLQRRRVAETLAPQPEVLTPVALPAAEPAKELEPHRGGIPIVPDVTKAAVRFIRPFVPPVVSDAIGGVTRMATKPLRQVFEETEEFHFTLRRTHRVTVESDATPDTASTTEHTWVDTSGPRIESARGIVLDESAGYQELGGPDDLRRSPPA